MNILFLLNIIEMRYIVYRIGIELFALKIQFLIENQ